MRSHKPPHKLFAWDVFVVDKEVALGGLAGVVDEDVCVGNHACYCADHVAIESLEFILPNRVSGNALVQDVELLS